MQALSAPMARSRVIARSNGQDRTVVLGKISLDASTDVPLGPAVPEAGNTRLGPNRTLRDVNNNEAQT
jgi:hypothetical protein